MKKLVFVPAFLIFIFFFINVQAQKPKVTSAYNYAKDGELAKAKEAIDEACDYETTKNDASTWKTRGIVYLEISRTTNPEYKKLSKNPMEESYNAVKKSIELDPDGRWTSENNNTLVQLSAVYYNEAVLNYNNAIEATDSASKSQAFTLALKQFETFWDIFDKLGAEKYSVISFLQQNKISINSIYQWTGSCASAVYDYDKAKKYFAKIVDLKGDENSARESGDPTAYIQYSFALSKSGFFDDAVEVLERAKVLWPNNKDILMTELNLYSDAKKMDELTKKLEDALVADPNNIILNTAYAGTLGDISNSFDNELTKEKKNQTPDQNKIKEYTAKAEEYRLKAVVAYNKAIDVNIKYKNELRYRVTGVSPSFDITYKNENGEMKNDKAVSGWEYSFNVKEGFQATLSAKGFDKKSNTIVQIYIAGNLLKEVKADAKNTAKAEYTITTDDLKKLDKLYDLYYNCGILFFNPGVNVYNDAVNLTDENQIKILEAQYLDYFSKALPYIEKAYALDPNSKEAKQILINIYLRNGNTEKASELRKK